MRVEDEVITSDEFLTLLEKEKVSKRQRRENGNKEPISLHVRIVKMLRRVSQIIKEEILYPGTNITFRITLVSNSG